MAPVLLLLLLLRISVAAAPPPPPTPAAAMELLAAALSSLGFNTFYPAALSLNSSPLISAWPSGPYTLFLPLAATTATDASLPSRSVIRDHLVAGIIPFASLSQLPRSTKLATASPARCLTVGYRFNGHDDVNKKIVTVDGVAIAQADLYNDGVIVVHAIQWPIPPRSSRSCSPGNDGATLPTNANFADGRPPWIPLPFWPRLWVVKGTLLSVAGKNVSAAVRRGG